MNPRTTPQKSFQRQADEEKRGRNKPWCRKAPSADRQQKKSDSFDSNENDEDQSAIWHHVFTEVGSKPVKNAERTATCYKNYFNHDDDYYYDDEEDYAKDGMELELLQPIADVSGKDRAPGGTAVIPTSATSTSVVMETASVGGGRMSTRTRLHKYQQQFGFCTGERRLSVRDTDSTNKRPYVPLG
jgi:hypothetical protein